MHDLSIYPLILVFLAAAIAIIPIFHLLKLNPIIGYIFAGVLVGKHGFGFVHEIEEVFGLAELGVIFLLFSIGLELTFERIKQFGWRMLALGLLQILATGLVIAAAAVSLGVDLRAAILIGGSLSLSSTALCLRLLTDRREQATVFGQIAISILLFQDLAVVPMMTLAPLFKTPDISIIYALLLALLKAVVAVLGILFLGRFVLRQIFEVVSKTKNAELFTATTLFVLLGTAYLTSLAGLSMALGAFLAGALLAETEYHHQVEADMHPFRGILLGLFFATVGMQIDLDVIRKYAPQILGLMAGLLVLKGGTIALLCLRFKMSLRQSIRVGLLLSQGGEFAFILLSFAVQQQFLDTTTSQILFGVIALSMVTTPFLDAFGAYLVRHRKSADFFLFTELRELDQHVLLIGFGRMGRHIATLLEYHNIAYMAVDFDEQVVAAARKRGKPVYFGDATHMGLLQSLGAEKAKVATITVDDAKNATKIAESLRKHFRRLTVVVRAHDEQHLTELAQVGIKNMVLETAEPSLQLSSKVLENMGLSESEILDTLERYRGNHYSGLSPNSSVYP